MTSRLRPLMNEYVQENPPAKETQQTSRPPNRVNPVSPVNPVNPVNPNPVKQENQNIHHEVYEEEKLHKTSQSHKKNPKDYKINPIAIPRPNQFDEVYRNAEKQNIYNTNEETFPPYSTSYFIVNETQNSNPRFIRSTMTRIPTDQSVITNSSLTFGLYCQPFAELDENEKSVPKVEVNDQIFRCKRCKSYINSKYEITYSKNNKRVAICNICNCENELDTTNPSVKSEYFSSDTSNIFELSYPTVDFYAPSNMKHTNPFTPHYIFLIDISSLSVELSLGSYVLNSISSNLDYIHYKEGSNVGIATFDHKSIQFYSIDNSGEVKIYIMPDIENPFCPLPMEKIYFNAVNNKVELEKIIERINQMIAEKSKEPKKISGSVTGTAIYAGIESLMNNGGRVMVFTCNTCSSGYGACKPKDESKIFNTQNEKTLYLPQHDKFNKLAEICLEKRIVVDQFILGNNQFDLATFSIISNLTGGSVNFYQTSNNSIDVKVKFEKLHYDLSRILTRPNYYDFKVMLRYTLGVNALEILGPFNKKLGEGFALAGCDPDYSFGFNLKLSDSFKPDQRVHFQMVCLYIDNFNQRYLRVFNHTVVTTPELSKIYSNIDVDALAKLTIMKEINMICSTDIKTARDTLYNKIVTALYYYRTQCSKNTPIAQLILPASIKYYPLYMNSFIKKPLLRKVKTGLTANSIVNMMNKYMHDPIYVTIKNLYPKFYRIDDIQSDQTHKFKNLDDFLITNVGYESESLNGYITKPFLLPLSLDNIDFDCSYMIDNGDYIDLIIFNYNNEDLYQELFCVRCYDDACDNFDSLDEANDSDLNVRVLNIINQLRKDNKGLTQPLRILFIDDISYTKPELSNNLIEDKTKDELHYVDFLCNIHEDIQKKMNS